MRSHVEKNLFSWGVDTFRIAFEGTTSSTAPSSSSSWVRLRPGQGIWLVGSGSLLSAIGCIILASGMLLKVKQAAFSTELVSTLCIWVNGCHSVITSACPESKPSRSWRNLQEYKLIATVKIYIYIKPSMSIRDKNYIVKHIENLEIHC